MWTAGGYLPWQNLTEERKYGLMPSISPGPGRAASTTALVKCAGSTFLSHKTVLTIQNNYLSLPESKIAAKNQLLKA